MTALSDRELEELLRRIFAIRAGDRGIAVLADLPDEKLGEQEDWTWRRATARAWVEQIRRSSLGLPAELYLYRNVHANNADLPASATRWPGGPLPVNAAALATSGWPSVPFDEIFAHASMVLAPTQLSATAPLKLAARREAQKHLFRAATLPGFNADMIPALRLDYDEIDRRVRRLQKLLGDATRAHLHFVVAGEDHRLELDLRHRSAHASSGLCTESGYAGNVPSGEAYITPYEGEIAGDASASEGVLPVELDGEVVLYRVVGNKAIDVLGQGRVATREAALLAREPAYGNMAELGLGVLADFGITPIGQTLLDEKLGLHVAFGRSDHFGGAVGPADFTSKEAVVHLDRVYLPALQPRVHVPAVDLEMSGGEKLPLMRDFAYVCGF